MLHFAVFLSNEILSDTQLPWVRGSANMSHKYFWGSADTPSRADVLNHG